MSVRMLRPAIRFCLLCAFFQAPMQAPGGFWLDVPFVRQVGNGCGPACISMVMSYWARSRDTQLDRAATEPAIRQRVNRPGSAGTLASDVSRYFQEHDFRTYVFAGAWDDLEHHLSQGRPLMVALAQGSDVFHFLVAAGIDSKRGILLVNDPARRKLRMLKRAEFEEAWGRCRFWTLLALPNHES